MGTCFLHGNNGGGSVSGFPDFTYTGDFQFIDDNNGNWRIKLLTSGTFTFKKLKNAANGIDVFCVGGGAGGGNGVQTIYQGTYSPPRSGATNTGGGGGGGGANSNVSGQNYTIAGSGGSGIVIIRNKR